jgi:hypothetical protein
MATKHNKLKNSGLLFEFLVRQITTDTLNNKDSEATNILKKYFHNTQLLKEYKIYDTIAKAKNKSEVKADVLINACLEAYNKLDKKELSAQKYAMIADIKDKYNLDEFFKAKVENYKIMASTYLLLEMHNSKNFDGEKYAECKYTLLEHITADKKDEKDPLLEEFASLDKGSRNLVIKSAHNKFEAKYKGFDENQKGLLRAYLTSMSTSDQFRGYCNESIKKVLLEVNSIAKEVDEVRKVKLTEAAKALKEIPANKAVSDADVTNILQYFELIKEYRNVSGNN